MAEPIVLEAITTFAATVGGVDYTVRVGNTLWSDHPLAKAHPEMFRKQGERVTFATPGKVRSAEPAIEVATSAPGEKRNR